MQCRVWMTTDTTGTQAEIESAASRAISAERQYCEFLQAREGRDTNELPSGCRHTVASTLRVEHVQVVHQAEAHAEGGSVLLAENHGAFLIRVHAAEVNHEVIVHESLQSNTKT